jgi:hypothetical protein
MITLLSLLDWLFSRFRWYRRLCGGHWEWWWVGYPICQAVWLQVERCTLLGGGRHPLCRGTPVCEDHPQRWLGITDW